MAKLTRETLPDLTDERLDDLYAYLLGKHREALGDNKADVHRAIMWIVAEFSRRLDAWLENLPPVPVARRP